MTLQFTDECLNLLYIAEYISNRCIRQTRGDAASRCTMLTDGSPMHSILPRPLRVEIHIENATVPASTRSETRASHLPADHSPPHDSGSCLILSRRTIDSTTEHPYTARQTLLGHGLHFSSKILKSCYKSYFYMYSTFTCKQHPNNTTTKSSNFPRL